MIGYYYFASDVSVFNILGLGGKRSLMVIPTGFEPVTCPLGGGCSIQLSHGTTLTETPQCEFFC